MLRVPSEINAREFESLKMQETTFVAYRSDVYPAKNDVFFEENALIYVLEGDKKFSNPKQEVHVQKGDVLFIRRGFYLMSESINESYRSLVFFFHEKLLKEFVNLHADLLFDTKEKANAKNDVALLLFHTNDSFAKFIETIQPYFKSNTPHLTHFLRLKYQELLLHLLSFDTSGQLHQLLRTIQKRQKIDLAYLLNDYFLKPLTIEELARLSGRSLSAFKREFRAEFQTSPALWIKNKRLEQAAFLLKNSNITIAEVSETVGYESVSHFIKAFKDKYGFTPKQVGRKTA